MVRRVAIAFGALVALYVGCHEPTEIVVRVTTSFDCSQLGSNPVGIRFGTSTPLSGATSAVSNACANGYVGSLVLTPSAKYNGDSLTVEVITALSPATVDGSGLCDEGTAGCIHARRTLPYLSGSAITVPIELQASCAGVKCSDTDTCVNAACVSSAIDPSQCKTASCLPGADGGLDAAPDVALDAPPPEAGPIPAGCGDMSGLLANAALPMSQYCPGHVGYGPYAGPAATPTLRHTVSTGLSGSQMVVPAQLVIDENDDVYFLTLDAKLHAFSARTGAEKWPAWATQSGPLLQTWGSVLLAADGTLYVSNDTQIYAVNRATGAPIGSPLTVIDIVRSSLTTGPLGLYFSGPNRTVETIALNPLAIGPSTSPTGAQIDGVAPAIVGGKIWVGDGVGKAYTFDATTLAVSATQPFLLNQTSAALSTMSAAPDGTMRTCFVSGGQGVVASFDSTVHWATAAGPASQCYIVAVTNDGSTLYTDDNYKLFVFDQAGNMKPYPGAHPRYPAVDVNRVVYTFDTSGLMTAYTSPSTTIWSSAINISPWAMYVGTDHDLIAVSDTEIDVFK